MGKEVSYTSTQMMELRFPQHCWDFIFLVSEHMMSPRYVAQHCHGVVCLFQRQERLFLWLARGESWLILEPYTTPQPPEILTLAKFKELVSPSSFQASSLSPSFSPSALHCVIFGAKNNSAAISVKTWMLICSKLCL